MTPQLRKTIEKLIRLDAEHFADDDSRGQVLTFGGGDEAAEIKAIRDVLTGGPNPTIAVLESLSNEDLSHVMALMLFGRGDGIAGPGATFSSVLDYAREQCDSRSAMYVAGKPLRRYLPAGLKRLGL